MKIACVYPALRDWPKFKWVHEALTRLGHDVVWVQSWKTLAEADAQSELVLFQHRYPIRWPNLKAIHESRTTKWVQWWFDLIATEPHRLPAEQSNFERYHDIMSAMDMVFVKEREFVSQYRESGVNAVYLDQGCPSDIRGVQEAAKTHDVLVWGQGCSHYSIRKRDVSALVKAGFTVKWASREAVNIPGVEHAPWTHPDGLPELASAATMVLSCGRRNDVDGYWSDGLWMALGMGCCVLRRHTAGMENGEFYSYRTHEELVAHATKLKADPELAAATGKKAREWTLANHSIEHRCRTLLEIASTARGPAS